MRTTRLNGETYFILFIEDYSQKTWVSFLRRKSKAFELFKVFKKEIENETNMKIKCLRSDHGG